MRADAEHHQRAEQEQQAPLEVAVLLAADVGKTGRHQALGVSSGLASSRVSFPSFLLGLARGLRLDDLDRAAGPFDGGARAPLEAFSSAPLMLSFFVSLPARMILAPSAFLSTMPAD